MREEAASRSSWPLQSVSVRAPQPSTRAMRARRRGAARGGVAHRLRRSRLRGLAAPTERRLRRGLRRCGGTLARRRCNKFAAAAMASVPLGFSSASVVDGQSMAQATLLTDFG